MKRLSFLLLIPLLAGCVLMQDEDIIGFGDRGVWITNETDFGIAVLRTNTVVIKEILPGKRGRYIQPWDDGKDLNLVITPSTNTSIVLTNLTFKGTPRDISPAYRDTTEKYYAVIHPLNTL